MPAQVPFRFTSSVADLLAALERGREAFEQFHIEGAAKRDVRTERIKNGFRHVQTIGHSINQFRRKLRLGEGAVHARIFDRVTHFAETLGAGRGCVANRDGTNGLNAETVFEVAVGIVEHDETHVVEGINARGNSVHRISNLALPRLRIRAVSFGVFGINLGQFLCDHVEPENCVVGRQPQVRIVGPVDVIVLMSIVMIIMLMFVMVIGMLCVFVIMVVVMSIIVIVVIVRFMVMIVIVVVIVILMIVVIMVFVVVVTIMRMFVVIMLIFVMIVQVKHCAFTERQLKGTFDPAQNNLLCIRGDTLQCFPQPWRQIRVRPNHNIRILHCARIRGTHRIVVGRRSRGQKDIRRANTVHHARDKAVDRGDVSHNFGRIGKSRTGKGGHDARKGEPEQRNVIHRMGLRGVKSGRGDLIDDIV